MASIWIDTDECMGAGTCEQIAPQLFAPRSDGTWAVKEEARFFGETRVFDGVSAPDGQGGAARVPVDLVDLAVEAAQECPAECIFVEA